MLVIGSSLTGFPILSIHLGGEVAYVEHAIVDPETLKIIAFELSGDVIVDPEIGNILMVEDIREYSPEGFIVDSTDVFVEKDDVIHLKEVLDLGFNLIGLKVVTKKENRKLGKVEDFTIDMNSFMIYQLIVKRPLMQSFTDPQLTINRSQITEIDDFKITIDHDREEIQLPTKKKNDEEFVPNFVNPFRKPSYAGQDEESSESSSKTSE